MKNTSTIISETTVSTADSRVTAPWLLSDYLSPNWRVRNNDGTEVNINFEEILPDGSNLSSPVNNHLMAAVRRVVFNSRSGNTATVESGVGQVALARGLILFISWMILHEKFYFSSLDNSDIKRYLLDSSKGYEVCFNTAVRVENSFKDLLRERKSLKEITFMLVYQRAGIPWTMCSKMPDTNAIFRELLIGENKKELKGESLQLALEGEDEQKDSILLETSGFIEQKKSKSGHTNKDKEKEKEKENNDKLTRGALFLKANAINLLWKNKKWLEDRLVFAPFPDGILEYVKKIGRPNGHTRTIPINVAFKIAENATIWVTKIGPALLNLRDSLNEFDTLPRGDFRTNKLQNILQNFNNSEAGILIGKQVVLKKKKGEDSVQLRTLLNVYLPTACFIVIAILTARRSVEITKLEMNAISGNADTGLWLKSLIAKTLRRFDNVPCPNLVADAVALINRFSELVRTEKGVIKLFIIPIKNSQKKTYMNFRIDRCINLFAKFVNVPKVVVDGELVDWNFASHQFRRIFAILFVWRFERGNLGALSYHLRHFNMKMTLVYVRDAELRKIIGEEYHRLTVSKLKSIATDDIVPVGTFGKLLNRLIDRIRCELVIADDLEIERKIIHIVDHRKLTIKATLWGYCGCAAVPSNIRRAKCQAESNTYRKLESDGTPDASGSDESICGKCLFHFSDGTRLDHWLNLKENLSKQLASPNCLGLIRNAIAARLVVVSSFLKNAFKHEDVG